MKRSHLSAPRRWADYRLHRRRFRRLTRFSMTDEIFFAGRKGEANARKKLDTPPLSLHTNDKGKWDLTIERDGECRENGRFRCIRRLGFLSGPCLGYVVKEGWIRGGISHSNSPLIPPSGLRAIDLIAVKSSSPLSYKGISAPRRSLH